MMQTEIQNTPVNAEMLLMQASKGDLDAFNQIVLIYQNQLYSYAYSILGDRFASEDVTQECFLKAFRNLRRFRGGSLRSWLLKIVRNSALDLLRQRKRRPTTPLFPEDKNFDEIESPAWLTDPGPSVQTMIEQRELSNRLNIMLFELPEKFRSVITLIDINEFSYEEAAEVLGVPIGTIRSRLARARRQMKDKLLGEIPQERQLPRMEMALEPVRNLPVREG